jgi:hypothetical protein
MIGATIYSPFNRFFIYLNYNAAEYQTVAAMARIRRYPAARV